MKGNYLWRVIEAVLPRVAVALIGALLGVLTDAGLMEGELGLELVRLLDQFGSRL